MVQTCCTLAQAWTQLILGVGARAAHFLAGGILAAVLLAGRTPLQYPPTINALLDDAPAWAATVLFILVAAAPLVGTRYPGRGRTPVILSPTSAL